MNSYHEALGEMAARENTRVARRIAEAESALDEIRALHQPRNDPPMSLVHWTYCSCGAMEVRTDDEGESTIAPAAYPCATLRVIERYEADNDDGETGEQG